MKWMHVVTVFVFVLLAAVPCAAQGMGTNAGCNMAGTWYGGSPDVAYPYYHLTVTPISADRFSLMAQLWDANALVGFLRVSDWTGEVWKNGPHTYSGMLFQMLQFDPKSPDLPPGVDPNLPELDFIHINSVEFEGCDTIHIQFDTWYMYGNFTNGIKPLVDPPNPGLIWNIDPPLHEVYHRIPVSIYARHGTTGTQWPHQGRRR